MMELLITLLLNLLSQHSISHTTSKHPRMLINILLTTRHLETNQRTHLVSHVQKESIHLWVNLWMWFTRLCCKTNLSLHWTTLVLMFHNLDHHGGMKQHFMNITRKKVKKVATTLICITKFKI